VSQKSDDLKEVDNRWPVALAMFFIGVFTVLLYAPKLGYPFVFDDMEVVADNQFIRNPANLKAIFSARYFDEAKEMSFRPLVTLSYFIDVWTHGATNFGCNLQNLVWLIVCGWLAFYLYRSFGLPTSLATAAVVLFVAHPSTVEIAFAEGHREWLIFLAFALASWLSFVSGARTGRGLLSALSLLLWGMSLFTMELALMLPFVFALSAWSLLRLDVKKVLRLTLPFLVILAAYLVFLFRFSGRDFGQIGKMWQGLSCSLELFYAYVRLTIFPIRLSPAHDICYRACSLARIIFALAVLLVLCLGFVDAFKRRGSALVFLAWYIVPAAFLFQPFFLPPVGFGDRYVSFGLLGWMGLLVTFAGLRTRRAVYARWLVTLVVAVFVVANLNYQRRWNSHVELWTHAVSNSPHSCIAQYNLGIAFLIEGKPARARRYFLDVIRMCPGWGKAWSALGTIERRANHRLQAKTFYRLGLESDPGCRGCYRALAFLEMQDYKLLRARMMFEELVEEDPSDRLSWRGLLSIGRLTGDLGLVRRANSALLDRKPPDLSASLLWAHVYWARGEKNKAIARLIDLIRWYPGEGEALLRIYEEMKSK